MNKFRILFVLVCTFLVGVTGCTGIFPSSPGINDENQKYESQYFSISYPKGWEVKELTGPDTFGSVSNGVIEEATQRFGPGTLDQIYFFDPKHEELAILIIIRKTDEESKKYIENAEYGDKKGFEKEYRDTEFNIFSTSLSDIYVGGIKGTKQRYIASNNSGQKETENLILLSTSNFTYQIQNIEKSNLNYKTIQRLNDIINSFSLSASIQSDQRNGNLKIGEEKYSQNNYSQAGGSNLHNADAYNEQGIMEYNQGDLNKAQTDFNKAIELNPNDESAYFGLGLINSDLGYYSPAISYYDKAILINPKNAEVYANRGASHYERRDFDEAISDYNKAIELNPNLAIAYNLRAIVYENREINHAQALLDLNKAIELNPTVGDFYFNRAQVYFGLKRYDDAWVDVHKAEEMGAKINQGFLNELKTTTGRDN